MDREDSVEQRDRVDGQGEGWAAVVDILPVLTSRGLSVPESRLDCRVMDVGRGGTWGLITCSSSGGRLWALSSLAVRESALEVHGDSQHLPRMARKCSMRAEVRGKWNQKQPLASSSKDCSRVT